MTLKLLITGPPGTGKTTAIMRLLAQLFSRGVHPRDVVLITYTTAGAREFRQRALEDFPEYHKSDFSGFKTLHAYCYHFLGLTQERVFTGEKIQQFGAEYGYQFGDGKSAVTSGDMAERILSYVRNTGEKISEVTGQFLSFARREIVNEIGPGRYMEKYLRDRDYFCRVNRLVDFSAMLQECVSECYPPRIRVLICDEAQDCSPLMKRTFDWLSTSADLAAQAGDPYQAIYGFMGARPELMSNWPRHRHIHLRKSYRCSEPVHRVAWNLQNRMRDRYQDDEWTHSGAGGRTRSGSTLQEALDGLGQGESVFLLSRTNDGAAAMRHTMKGRMQLFRCKDGGKSPLEMVEAIPYVALEKLAGGRGIDKTELIRLTESVSAKGNLVRGAKKRIKSSIPDDDEGLYFLDELEPLGYLPGFREQIADRTAYRQIRGSNRDYFHGVIDLHGGSVLLDQPEITISTIHGAKGAEADRVIIDPELPWFLNSRVPDEIRLAYVAASRARTQLYILSPYAGADRVFRYPTDGQLQTTTTPDLPPQHVDDEISTVLDDAGISRSRQRYYLPPDPDDEFDGFSDSALPF